MPPSEPPRGHFSNAPSSSKPSSSEPSSFSPSVTSSIPNLRRLDGRLQHLFDWVCGDGGGEAYDHIWDLCCDHGRLGMHLYLASEGQPIVHLVDAVPQIVSKLQQLYGNVDKQRLQLQCQDASQLSLKEGSHLVVIAGVGGELAQCIIRGLFEGIADLKSTNIRLLISANNRTYELRKFLRSSEFYLVSEAFVEERGRCYEHLDYRLCSKAPEKDLELQPIAGGNIWQPMNSAKLRYLQKLAAHYQAQARGGDLRAAEVAAAYQRCFAENT